MRQTAYPLRPRNDQDILWWVSFIEASGRRKPNGMTGLCWAVYPVVATSRADALAVLGQANDVDWDMRCGGLSALRAGAEVRLCEFDLARRQVIRFDPTGLDPKGHHYYAIVDEWPTEGEVVFPTRGDALWAREQTSRARDAELLASVSCRISSLNELPAAARALIRKRRGCWIWQGNRNWGGYGRVEHAGEQWSVHRLTYTLLKSEIPDGAVLRHLCHNPACCNPDHLLPGTHFANAGDKKVKRDVRKLLGTPGLDDGTRLARLRDLYLLR